MDEKLQLLVHLQKFDTNILSLSHKIDSMPSHKAAEEAPYKEAIKTFESARQNQTSLEKKKKDKERQIEDLEEKIKKLKARSSDIKTNKEYQANLKEIESVEAEIRSSEDEILALMEIIETSSKKVAAEEARLASIKAHAEGLNKEREKEISVLEQELQSFKEKRKLLVEKVDPDLYSLYMGLLRQGRGIAVAEVVKEICQGCNMNIPPQLFVEIKSGDTIFQCPQCRRILYFDKPADEHRETAEGN